MGCGMEWEFSALDYSNQFHLMWFVTDERINPACDGGQISVINKYSIANHLGVLIQERSASTIEHCLISKRWILLNIYIYILECYPVSILNCL